MHQNIKTAMFEAPGIKDVNLYNSLNFGKI